MRKLEDSKLCIIGLGYVGLPLAHAFASKFDVVGFDISVDRVNELQSGFDRTLELDSQQLESVSDNIVYSHTVADIKDCNIFIVTVPTPIDASNRPDLSPLIGSSEIVGSVLKKGDLVIYESTVYPGVTEDVCVPVLEQMSHLTFNTDFYCGYSPERINPGDTKHTVTNILKITSGSTPEVATFVDDLYSSIIVAGTHKASSIKVAEAAKVIENTQRDVNIALINELAIIFDSLGIDTNDVIEAAATKWNFIKLHPGLVGGHCIGVDPYYLTHKAEELGYKPNLILGARQINNGMGKFIADKMIKLLIQKDKKVKSAKILIMGLTFKENCPDIRNTKVVDIISELKEFGCHVDIYEPWIHDNDKLLFDDPFVTEPFEGSTVYDGIVVAVGHEKFKKIPQESYDTLVGHSGVIVDVKCIVPKPTWKL